MPMTYQERQRERLLRRIEELRSWRNAAERVVAEWTMVTNDGGQHIMQVGDIWPVVETPVYMNATGTIPGEWKGMAVELELALGGEGFVELSTGLQAGLNPLHHRFPVTEEAEGGESISIDAEVVPKGLFGSHILRPRIECAQFVVPLREARAYERDLSMLVETAIELGDHEVVPFLLDTGEASFLVLADAWPTDSQSAVSRYVRGFEDGVGENRSVIPEDILSEAQDNARPTKPLWSLPVDTAPLAHPPSEAVLALAAARRSLSSRLDDIETKYPAIGNLTLTGHAHIDLAWLWPVVESRRKIRRTFSTVCNLMDHYPDFTFNQSSAQAYAWIEEDDPDLFEIIRKRVEEQRWEPIGGMWVEADANVTGGEAFVRQLLYGQRYFQNKFGIRNRTVWLPDVFGYSGGMPQLMKQAGIDSFFTTKLTWNESNRFPHDLFIWEGVDGSTVVANILFNPGHGYNGNIIPRDTHGTWSEFRSKTQHFDALLPFGWGDGAGGPSERMLENYDRIKDYPVLPKLKMGLIEDYFDSVSPDGLPVWSGELYLEFHRGTLTSQAKVKELNRKSELRLVEAETFGAIASLDGYDFPAAELETAWKTLLLNQFHDILPGSSIREVYEDTHRELEAVVETATAARDDAIAAIGSEQDLDDILIANPSLHARPLVAIIPGRRASSLGNADSSTRITTQEVEGATLIFAAGKEIPGTGWSSLSAVAKLPGSSSGQPDGATAKSEDGGEYVLENDRLLVVVGKDGSLSSVFDKSTSREVLADRGNQLWAYVDKPYEYDAWDVDESYEMAGAEITDADSIEIVESGPIRAAVRVSRTFRESQIVQTYQLWAHSARIDIHTEIDWHQRQTLIKSRFPVTVHTHEATFETMYGVVKRPTHRNTPFDAAKFEVCGHRFADMSEPGYGVALLNDSKYGYDVHDNVLSLSLVRGPLYPDPTADEGIHRFTYSLYPHSGGWHEGGVVDEAIALNSPLVIAEGISSNSVEFFAHAEGLPIQLGSLKKAEEDDCLILRVYEPHGARGNSTIRFGRDIEHAELNNLLEESLGENQPLNVDERRQLALEFGPFEVKSIKLHVK